MKTVMRTYSGIAFDLLHPVPADVSLRDIAWHLSQLKRFTGAGVRGFTVAEHSIHVYRIVRELLPDMAAEDRTEMLRAALFHDAHEAYIGDWSTPLKNSIGYLGRDKYQEIRLGIDLAIGSKFGFRELLLHDPLVKAADAAALLVERDLTLQPALTPDREVWPDVGDYPLAVAREVIGSQRHNVTSNGFLALLEAAQELGVTA